MKPAPVLSTLFVAFAALCPAQSLPETAPQPGVQVRLSISKAAYKPGEPVEITALIQNVGTEPFYVWEGIGFAHYGEGIFTPHLTDSGGKDVPELFRAGGHRGVGRTDFAQYVETHWLYLAPRQFYGVTESRFASLLRPGEYSLVVEYSSSVFPWSLAGETFNEVQESAKKLKYAALLGKFRSNEVTFIVTR